jgi:DUF4097 and DUF4098 domain-containing protein YvlB
MIMSNLKWVAVFCLLVPFPAIAGESVDERWNLDSDASVSIENIAGEIVIEGWKKNEARLTGELGDSVDELEFSATDSSLQITVVNRHERNIDNSELKLMIPTGANVDAMGVSADITIKNLDNDKLTASSVSGNVDVEVNSQWVSIESVSGDVEFNGQSSRISAESVSGDMDLSGVSGEILATTVSGDLNLDAGIIESAKFETVSGDMTAGGELSENGRLTAESMSGDVVINLPSSQSGLFKAQSFSGRIYTDFGSVQHAKHGPGSHLKHKSGNSSAEVRVESFSGNIKLKHD